MKNKCTCIDMPGLKMCEDCKETAVVFRVYKKDGDVLALFPNIINYPDGACESYQHIGQHGAAHYSHCISITRPAKPNEYRALKHELESIGYKLNVRKRK